MAQPNSRGRPRRHPPATTPEGRENQLIAAAMDLAEEQMLAGTAPAQTVVHFLKLGTQREQLERDKIRKELILLEARAEAIESQKRTEELYSEALKAMKAYSGQEIADDYDPEDF